MNLYLKVAILVLIFYSCQEPEHFDLVIEHANILEVESGEVLMDKSIYINDGIITKILNKKINVIADTIISAKGKLVSPSFIDTHVHAISEFADGKYDKVTDAILTDSMAHYKQKLTDGFLPFGTTSIMLMGNPDKWTDMLLEWGKNTSPNHINVQTSGGALATDDGHDYPGHLRVKDSIEARDLVIDYHKRGVKHLKLYWRLQESELKALVETADSLDIPMFAHIGGFLDASQLVIPQVLPYGVKHYEHFVILPCSIMNEEDWKQFEKQAIEQLGEMNSEPILLLTMLELFRYVKEHKNEEFEALVSSMVEADCTVSTTIGFLYQQYKSTLFSEPKDSTFSEEVIQRSDENFAIMMEYLRKTQDAGIEFRIGTDSKDGGQLLLLELMLLSQHGFTPAEAIKIATINGAKAMNLEEELGSINKGNRADLIIWEKNPLENYKNFTADKIIIKDGFIFALDK